MSEIHGEETTKGASRHAYREPLRSHCDSSDTLSHQRTAGAGETITTGQTSGSESEQAADRGTPFTGQPRWTFQASHRRSDAMNGTVYVIILMGPAGAGKSTVGRRLANELGWRFVDADDFHPPGNLDKMTRNLPLTDEDRRPWLERLRTSIAEWVATGSGVILACSLLKTAYRTLVLLPHHAHHVRIVYLKATRTLLQRRLLDRRDHVMKVDLLDSQLETLEEPIDTLALDASESPSKLVQQIRTAFDLSDAV